MLMHHVLIPPCGAIDHAQRVRKGHTLHCVAYLAQRFDRRRVGQLVCVMLVLGLLAQSACAMAIPHREKATL